MPSQFSILTPMKNFKQGALMEAFKNATTLASTPEEKEEQPPDQNGHSEKAVDVNGLPKSPYEDEDDEDKPKLYEPSWFSKFLNYLFCRPDLAKKKLMAKPVSIAGLFRYRKPFDILCIILGTLCAIISGVLNPILALLGGQMTNVLLTVEPHTDEFRTEGYKYVFMILGIGIFALVINFMQYMFFITVCNRVCAQLRHQYVKAIIRQNAGWFDRNLSGTLTTRLNDNINRVREGIGDKLGLLIRGFAMFASAFIVALIYQWRVALVMFGLAPITTALMSIMSQLLSDNTTKEMAGVGKAGAIAEEAVLGVRTVQAFNGQEEIVQRYEKQLDNGKKFAEIKGLWSGLFSGLFSTVLFVFIGIGMYYGGWLYKVGIFDSPGDVFVCVFSMLLGSYFLGLVSPHLMVLLNARVAASTIYQTIDRVPKIDVYSKSGKYLPNPIGHVEFKNVHFRYPTRKDQKILNGLNLSINPGQTVALVGHSGCGKSTSVGLLTRLYEAEKGHVMIDGEDVIGLNINHLRNVVGIVQQEPVLFNDTIAENLRMGNPDITKEKMVEVCKMANAHGFIQKLPKKYDTQIGDGGVQLSGGQKQRIAIARTLARDPKVLLLDEATSALDAHSEEVVQSALYNAAKGRTTIMIAHRLSTVKNADVIVYFENGVIVEQGNHEELVKLGGKYAELVKAQQFDIQNEPQKRKLETVEEVDLEDDDEPKKVQFNPKAFDDITRSSMNYGHDQFIRGTERNDDAMRDSITRDSLRLSGNVVSPSFKEETEAFMAEVQAEMTKDSKIRHNLLSVYANAHGSYKYMLPAFAMAVLRGGELPLLSVLLNFCFAAFALYPIDPDQMTTNLIYVMIGFFVVGVFSAIIQLFANIFSSKASETLTQKLRLMAFRAVLYQDAAYFDNPQNTAGKIITRLATDAPNVKAVVDGRMIQVIHGSTTLLVCSILSFTNCWEVALTVLVYNVTLGITMGTLARIIQKKNLALARNDDAGKTAIEIIENVKTIQLLTREELFYRRYETASKNMKHVEFNKSYFEAVNNSISQSYMYLCMTIAYAMGIHVINIGIVERNAGYQSIVSMQLAASAVMHSATYFPEFVKANTAAGLIFNMIFRKPKTGDVKVGDKIEIHGNIEFEDVKFTYPQKPNQPVMRELNFKATRGQTVALVGPSGSGKSTVISMLERYYDPTNGAVRFDGKDLKNLSLEHLRKQMALVGQMPTLFAGSIKENICFGLGDDVPQEQIDKALEIANAKDFVYRFPQGLETEVGEKGTQMSGGQKQRIAIARALIRNPKILLLDEATSALDSQSEKAVQVALDRASYGRTCITIAHRLSSIQNSDLILFIENGKVREAGTHNELIEKRGKYFELIRMQDLST